MNTIVFKEARIINRGRIYEGDLLVRGNKIERVDPSISVKNATEVKVDGKFVMPGVIDDQVHFREPGLDYKGNIYSESMAAVAGGVTSFMEMPNTKPPALTQALLEEKYKIASTHAWANYSFYMGAANDNIDEVLKTDPSKVCGVKVFMGSSTGNMLVDNTETLEQIFSKSPTLVAVHCEDEKTIIANLAEAQSTYGEHIPPSAHPVIRSHEACIISSSLAISLAKRYNTRLHILHITTAGEAMLFDKGPVANKRITSEACVHHMFYADQDYITLGNQIKCNPAIKTAEDREAILKAVLEDRIDIIASDHAPHTWEEKSASYLQAPSGLPLVQHELLMMLSHWSEDRITLEKIVEKMCHAPSDCFRVIERGYLDEGYFADIVVLDTSRETFVSKENLLYKCGWSPLEGIHLPGVVESTWINGICSYSKGKIMGMPSGDRLTFKGHS
jgi:dihydroorotase